MTEFDPFAQESINPDEGDGIYFGELFLYRGFRGIWLRDTQLDKNVLTEYDPNNEQHRQSGKKPMIYYQIQAFPIDVANTFDENLVNFSDEWKELTKSLAAIWNIDQKSDAYSQRLRDWSQQSIFCKYHVDIVEYKDKNGIDRKKYIKRVQEIYPDMDACQAAHDAHRGIGGTQRVENGATVQALPRDQALQFIETWVKGNVSDGNVDESALQDFIDGMPMLGDWEVSDEAIQKIVNAVAVPF